MRKTKYTDQWHIKERERQKRFREKHKQKDKAPTMQHPKPIEVHKQEKTAKKPKTLYECHFCGPRYEGQYHTTLGRIYCNTCNREITT